MKKLRKWLRRITRTKLFHIFVIAAIILALIGFAYMTIKKYDEEGEKEMPFELSKINVISSVSGESIDSTENDEAPGALNGIETARWNINVSQNNDFYIYIEKNENYKGRKQEAIKSVEIQNIEIHKENEAGEIKIYRPDAKAEKELFKNTTENEVESIEYIGAAESNVKNLQMSNQGDLIFFRFTNKNIKKYFSNDEELNYSELLKKAEIQEESLKATIKFDLIINLESRKSFNTTVTGEIPITGIVEKGTTSEEIIDVNKLIFKRN